MRKMIALLVLGTSLALAGNAAFAGESGETLASTQVVAAQATDNSVTMGSINSSADLQPIVFDRDHDRQ